MTMKIELKNIKYSETFSEETNCYEASIYINGKREGVVDNDGRGGSDTVHPWQLAHEIDAYAKTLPPIEWTDSAGEKHFLPQTHETIFGDLITDWLIEKDLKRFLNTRVIYLRDGKLFETRPQKPPQLKLTLTIPTLKAKLQASEVLNLLPFSRAKQIYKECAHV